MLCPEVSNFNAPYSTFNIHKVDNGKSLSNDIKINNFFYNHLVSVTVPDSLRFPENLTETLITDCEYYKICDFNPGDLLNKNFLNFFVRSGKLTLLTIDTRIDCDNCIGIIPTGHLIISVNKETFQSLGLEGTVSHFTKKIKDRYIIKFNLKEDYLEPGKPKYEKMRSNLQNLGRFTVILLWEPSKPDVCPSSVAKFFCDLGYNVSVSFPSFSSNTVYSVKVPKVNFDNDSEEDVTDFIEWLGMISLDGDLETDDPENYQTNYLIPEPNEKLGQVKFLQWRGLFSVEKIKDLLNNLMIYAATASKTWISVYVQGFSDSPVSWGIDEHHYFTNGDNAYIAIFNPAKSLLCTQKCSRKQYK